jgi:Leucine-rich repeat (LRR) protein
MLEQAFQLVLKFYSKNNNNQNNNNLMRLRLVCSTFNNLVLNNILRLNIRCSYERDCCKTLRRSIRMMPNLTCINLEIYNNHEMRDEYGYFIKVTESNLTEFLYSIVNNLPKLTSLGIRYGSNSVEDVNTELLANSIATLTALKSLYLDVPANGIVKLTTLKSTSLKVPAPQAYKLVPILDKLSYLKSLKIQCESIIPLLAQTLANTNMNLTKLDLSHNKIGDSEIALLVPGLTKQTDLVSLILANNLITDAGMELLGPIICQMTKLTSINIKCNKISSLFTMASFVFSLNKHKLQNLTGINLGSNCVSSNGYYISLLGTIAERTNLTSLGLDGCCFVSMRKCYGRKKLERVFNKLPNLKCLSLANNKLKLGVPSLAKLTNLMSLDLSNNDLGSDEISLLAPSLIRMTNMTSLNLESNPIEGLAGAQSLIPILRGMGDLKFLKIDGFHLGAEGEDLLLDVFRTMPELRYEF